MGESQSLKNENVKLITERDSVQEKFEKLESTLNSSICESDTLTKNLQENNKILEENVTKFKIELAEKIQIQENLKKKIQKWKPLVDEMKELKLKLETLENSEKKIGNELKS